MDYAKKLDRMTEHLKEHPHDYQTVIARLKTASDMYDAEVRKRRSIRLRNVSEIRKRLREEDERRGVYPHTDKETENG